MKKSDFYRKKWQITVLLVVFCSIGVKAGDDLSFDLGADIVSSYVWRGNRQTGLSVQPTLGVNYKGLSLTAWGSTDLNFGSDKGFKEVDFTLGYSIKGFRAALTDYWWDGEGAYHYFSKPKSGYSGHMFEATLGYTLPEVFPLSLTWNSFFAGKGNEKANGDNSFSTYIELSYPFSVKTIDFNVAAGFTPWESVIYATDGFKVTNLSIAARKEFRITDGFTLPIFTSIIFNPAVEDVHFVFGFRLGI